jgi:hypothetical protein
MCKFKGEAAEPHDKAFFERWITRGNGGVNDFFHDVSYGKCNLDGSQVFGWFALPYTKAEDSSNSRYDRIAKAAAAVQDRVDFTKFYGICIVTNVYQDSGALNPGVLSLTLNGSTKDYGIVVLDPWGWQPSVACQELSHGFNLSNHTRAAANPTQDYQNPFDIMSTLTSGYMFADSRYDVPGISDHLCGPGMNAPNLDEFGWIDAGRIFKVPTAVAHNSLGFNTTTLDTYTIQLSALNHPETNHSLCATVDTYSAALGSFTYYLEYRTADGWDRGMAAASIPDCVVIEQARSDQYNYLVAPSLYSNCLRTGQSFADPDTNITVTVLGFSGHVATIEVTLPVHHRYRQAVDGPNPPDWHIYELLQEHINVVERSAREVRTLLKLAERLQGVGQR